MIRSNLEENKKFKLIFKFMAPEQMGFKYKIVIWICWSV